MQGFYTSIAKYSQCVFLQFCFINVNLTKLYIYEIKYRTHEFQSHMTKIQGIKFRNNNVYCLCQCIRCDFPDRKPVLPTIHLIIKLTKHNQFFVKNTVIVLLIIVEMEVPHQNPPGLLYFLPKPWQIKWVTHIRVAAIFYGRTVITVSITIQRDWQTSQVATLSHEQSRLLLYPKKRFKRE